MCGRGRGGVGTAGRQGRTEGRALLERFGGEGWRKAVADSKSCSFGGREARRGEGEGVDLGEGVGSGLGGKVGARWLSGWERGRRSISIEWINGAAPYSDDQDKLCNNTGYRR